MVGELIVPFVLLLGQVTLPLCNLFHGRGQVSAASSIAVTITVAVQWLDQVIVQVQELASHAVILAWNPFM